MANNFDLKPGDIIAKCWGYSMVLYTFYKVVRISNKFVFLQELEKKVDPSTEDGFRPLVVPDLLNPVGKVIRKGMTTYIGNVWDGKPCQEDHLD